jgi:metal-responsive CopG/Arc/MetJ family transcriptional regulator
MRIVQMTLEPALVSQVDRAAAKLGVSRSAFTRRALRLALEQIRVEALEHRHREGYARRPVRRGEFDGWEAEQVWPQ